MKNAIRHLTDLGLKAEDAKIYLTCMKKPQGLFVHEIHRQTDIKRSTVDLILNRLRKQGFISRHKEGARWVYCAEPPEKISFSFEQKLQNFQDILPQLLSMTTQGQRPTVRFFEGAEGLEQLFDDILLTCQILPSHQREIVTISSGKDLFKLLPTHERQFIRKRIKRGIPVRLLAPKNRISERLYKDDKSYLRETKFFDEKKHPFNVEIDIYGDKVALLNFNTANATGTIIQNKAIAASMRSLFEMLWNTNAGL